MTGSERTRWLDGMVSADIQALEGAGAGSASRALLLTHQGRIVADLRVLTREDAYLLELARDVATPVVEHLDRYIIADDVTLTDVSPETARLAVEGPRSHDVVGVEIPPGGCAEVEVAGHATLVADWSYTGGTGRQLFLEPAAVADVAAALREAGAGFGLVEGDAAALECLRIEGGQPLQGHEIDDTVLPAEVRLDEAVSETKGCYTGQEVVARMRSRGAANHLLVGLRFDDGPPSPGTELAAEGRRAGELTSAVVSPHFGAIGLGYVKAALAEPGTEVRAGDAVATVTDLPFGS